MPNIKAINVPTLVIQNENDGYLDRAFIDAYYETLTVEKEMLWVDIPVQRDAFHNRAAAYVWIGGTGHPAMVWNVPVMTNKLTLAVAAALLESCPWPCRSSDTSKCMQKPLWLRARNRSGLS